jgi:hypothetical protein
MDPENVFLKRQFDCPPPNGTSFTGLMDIWVEWSKIPKTSSKEFKFIAVLVSR